MVDGIVGFLSRLSLVPEDGLAETAEFCRKDVEEWIEIETNELVAEASISGACGSIHYGGELQNQSGSDAMMDDCVAEDECEITERRAVPSAVVLARLFKSLESLGVECDVSNDFSHLRSAKRAFLDVGETQDLGSSLLGT
ncbi:unnamed protein product [Chondrus crispus]|uniref:Uncharacterized protein n=1 Tax=Chondrus crispus TaxID=2769 RepID=R7Q336_CHOCR|nr:unnamed protein product [Chondrus crispus]CDF32313.1 unnamed protein product [Chondrus crispus]|eukprot:XP_005711978.1 unnamed protein product [Chondrus crispus]